MIHPSNHLERLRIEKKKSVKKTKEKAARESEHQAGRLWRAQKERDKEKELEHEYRDHVS